MLNQLDIIIPVKNESANIAELAKRLNQVLTTLGVRHKLIFVDDHSSDNTLSKLSELAKKYPIIIHKKQGKIGKAYSIFEGAALSDSPYLAMIDGDLQYPPEALKTMLELVPGNGVVVANRKILHTSGLRRLASGINNRIFNHWLLGLKCDTQSGLKIFKREILDYLDPANLEAWALDVPLLMTALNLGLSIGEVDIEFSKRTGGDSKVRLFSATLQIVAGSLKTRFRSPGTFTIPGKSGDSLIGAGVIHNRRRYITHNRLPLRDSAVKTFAPWQKLVLLTALVLIIFGLVVATLPTAIFLTGVLTLIYTIDSLFNFFIVYKSLQTPPEIKFTDKELKALDKKNLPVYTVLCPLYREAGVLPAFVESITRLDWPKDKLDVILLLEEDDKQTLQAAENFGLPQYFRTVIVPDSAPKTKPKACNYGLNFAKGEFTVVFDAEDKPDPLQLKKAYLGFSKLPENIVCLQGKLSYYNPHSNLLTRMFTAEYSLWFDVILPGLQSINTTIPLGGTSNHFRTEILKKLHGWDAFNVTEDCDLGARLFKNGYQTAIIDSVTLEEANGNLAGWVRQRSRWIKGYIQTFLVHNRRPVEFLKKNGIHALVFQLIIGLRITFMIINPLLWLATISYFTLYKFVGPAIESIYPSAIFYMAVFSLVFGNFTFFYNYMIGCAKRERWDLIKYVYLIPVYWLMISFAAIKAVYQLLAKPHYWEKTNHGLSKNPEPATPEFVPVSSAGFRFNLSYINKLTGGEAIGAGILIASSVFNNFFNFLYNAFLSHSQGITLADFGTISLMGSFISILQIPTSALSRTVTYRSGFLLGKFSTAPKQFWSYIRENAFKISLVATAIWLILSPLLPGFFGSNSALPFILFSPIWIIGTLSAVDGGFLAGNTRFTLLAVTSVLASISKFLFTLVFIRLGLTSFVYATIPLSSFISFIFTWQAARKLRSVKPLPDVATITHFPAHFFSTSVLQSISTLSFLSLDIVLAKIFLTPNQAGQYALISLIGKIVYFAGTIVSQFITPVVSRAEGAGKNSRPIFFQLLLISTLVSLMGAVVFGFFGKFTAPVLFGPKILPVVGLLPWFTLAMVAFAIASNIVNYYQIRHQYLFSYLSVLTAPIQIFFLYVARRNLEAFIAAMFYYGILYLLLVVLLHLYYRQLKVVIGNLLDLVGLFQPQAGGKQVVFDSRLRILIFNWRDTRHVWAGGAEVYIHEIAKRWVKKGSKVTVFCGSDGKSPRDEYIDGVKIIRRGGFFTVYFWAPIYYFFRLRNKYDVIIDCENGIPFYTPLYAGVPVFLLIHHVHQDYLRQHAPFPFGLIAMFLESKVMPFLYQDKKIITVSESSRTDISRVLHFSEKNIEIINPGIDPSRFNPGTKTAYPSFAYLGRIRPYKNVDMAIMAFSEILNINPNARLTIAGWGENISELKALSFRLGISGSVEFVEWVSEKQKGELMGKSWAMLQPSSFEGWGITVIESNACGTPVIASDVGGLRDSVINHRTGILVPAKNAHLMAEAMKSIITHENLRTKLSASAMVWSHSFDWDVKAGSFLNIIYSSLDISQTRNISDISPAYIDSQNI
jgi:cellulose synthase/poly-beta-1,6-N-acetylglucosamine synthase-like glycosyltransferase/glycosyltransferase involved in cell wall biosynthesis/O-antigen/teichoic acid export membrane protein